MVTVLVIFFMIFQVSAVFERLSKCYFAVSISFTRKFGEKKDVLDCFSLKNHGQSFSLKHLFLQFSSRINRGFYFSEFSLSEEIRGILLYKNEFYKKYIPS